MGGGAAGPSADRAPDRSEAAARARLVRTRGELREALAVAPRPLGLVPTMGSLHEGHLSLIRRARSGNATVLVTLFVNPRQFNEAADYAAYPRDEAADVAAATAAGAGLLFIPPVDEVYPAGFDTSVRVGALTVPLEGAARPGHFEGVTTVVAILFGLARADRAYFGQKDAQQLLVVRRMAADLGTGTEVVACPTVREPDGLAMSSRNVLLTPEQRAAAPAVRRALLAARTRYEGGERDAEVLRAAMRTVLGETPGAVTEYASCADTATLAELSRVEGPALLSLAVRFGAVRLIDNEPLP